MNWLTSSRYLNVLQWLSFTALLLILNSAEAKTLYLFNQEEIIELGELSNSDPIEINLVLENNSTEAVSGIQVTGSCGCTVVEFGAPALRAGEQGKLRLKIDPIGKRGKTLKTLFIQFQYRSNPISIQKHLEFTIVNLSAHSATFDNEKFFGPKCGSCHAVPAHGKTGQDLFISTCAFCHGLNAQGASGPGFTRLSYLRRLNRSEAKAIITFGLPEGFMPGFGLTAGGPLTDEQIDSLVDYLYSLKEKWQQYL